MTDECPKHAARTLAKNGTQSTQIQHFTGSGFIWVAGIARSRA